MDNILQLLQNTVTRIKIEYGWKYYNSIYLCLMWYGDIYERKTLSRHLWKCITWKTPTIKGPITKGIMSETDIAM